MSEKLKLRLFQATNCLFNSMSDIHWNKKVKASLEAAVIAAYEDGIREGKKIAREQLQQQIYQNIGPKSG